MLKAKIPDNTPNIDVLTETLNHEEDRGRDLRAFQMAMERERSLTATRSLFRVLATGPLPPSEAGRFAEVYQRGIAEVQSFFDQGKKS